MPSDPPSEPSSAAESDGVPGGSSHGLAGTRDDVPDFAGARDHVVRSLVSFVRRLRSAGASVPANGALAGAEALATVGLTDRDAVRAALQAALLTEPADAEPFEEHFPAFWYRLRTGLEASAAADELGDGEDATQSPMRTEAGAVDERPPIEGDAGEGERLTRRVAGPNETDEERATDSAAERVETYSAVGEGDRLADPERVESLAESDLRRFERALAKLPGRRWETGEGPRVDARRALRASLTTGGTPVALPQRTPKPTAFRPCVLADVSGSVLDTIDRGLLVALLARLQRDGRDARTFLFDTDLREVSHAFAGADAGENPADALRRAEIEWGGGTRIGDALATLRRQHPTAIDRRTVVIVVSDGLDVGEPDRLERGMAWLAGRAGAVLWLNPLAAGAEYRPTCRGMATALPYVDGLFAFARSADLVEIARQLEQHGLGGPLGYEHDPRRTDS